MAVPAALSIELTFSDHRLDDEEREDLAQELCKQLQLPDSDLGAWHRIYVDAPPGTKSLGAQVIGVLAAVVSAASLKGLFAYLTERWRGHEISIDIDVNGKKIKIVARSQEDLIIAYNATAALLSAQR